MSCQICVEVCPFDAIKMDVEYELSTGDRFGGLLIRKQQLAKANDYYRKIHPAEAPRWTHGSGLKRPRRKRRPRPPRRPNQRSAARRFDLESVSYAGEFATPDSLPPARALC